MRPAPASSGAPELLDHARAAGLDLRFRAEGDVAHLPRAVDLAVHRVLQERLTNVRKHAGAGRGDVLLRYVPDAVTVQVAVDGDGFGAADGSGRGLAGLRERVALLGGEFAAGPESSGCALRVRLPLA